MVERFAGALGRGVRLRPGTSDQQVFDETFGGLFHVPPDWMPAPRSVLDLGANIGLVAAHYSVLWPDAKIVCVEPDPMNAAMARLNLGDGVRVLECAVGGSPGRGRMSGDESYALRLERESDGPVQVDTFAGIVRRLFPDGVDFVKVDVEGMEWMALREIPSVVRSLLIELHPRVPGDSDERMIIDAQGYLSQQGFLSQPHRVHPRAVFAWRA